MSQTSEVFETSEVSTAVYPTHWPEWFEIISAVTFSPRGAFSVDAPDRLAKLPPRLQESHAGLLARCGVDQQTYPQLIHIERGHGVQGTTSAAQGTTPAAQDSTPDGQAITNNYKEEVQKKK